MTVYEAVSVVAQFSVLGLSVLTLVVSLIISQKKK